MINKNIIVTGGSQSIGRATALAFAKLGSNVVISYHRDEAGAAETVAQIKALERQACAIKADFSHVEAVAAFAQSAIDFLGHIDVLVNNAGMLCRETLLELPLDKLQQTFYVNAISPLYLTQLCAQHMVDTQTKGVVINISSVAASTRMPRSVAYASSKAAMNNWTGGAALSLAEHGIRVNTISPGVIQSGMNEDTEQTNPALWKVYMQNTALKRPGKPEDIANMAVFLASDEAQWITGKVFEVDGGYR